MKAAVIINARDKERFVERAVRGALSQTYPCEVLLSDQFSTDKTYDIMARLAAEYRGSNTVRLLRCPVNRKKGMQAMNEHIDWCVQQTDAEWIFTGSADDYMMPDRVKVCMEAVERVGECAGVATTMYFLEPGQEAPAGMSGEPKQSGFVDPAGGLKGLVFGSVAAGWNRAFLEKVGSAGACTPDVYYGYLAAVDKGFFVITDPQYVHVAHADLDNTGFQGKMRAARSPAENEMLAELNRFQLLDLYYSIALKLQELYPMAHDRDKAAILDMVLAQAKGWLDQRKRLHELNIPPGSL